MSPPNETGGADDAARLELNYIESLLSRFQKINSANYPGWQRRAQKMFVEYVRTGSTKHLDALDTHLNAMRARII